MCKGTCCGKGCSIAMVGKILLIVGGINWGLVGLSMLFSQGNWNIVNMIFGGMPMLEGVVYLLVGVAAVMKIFGCKCSKCSSGSCEEGKAEGSM